MARAPAPRYGIAEWFGKDITAMAPDERKRYGELAAYQDETGDLSTAPICPFLSTLIPGAKCNKAGGVCSIRQYDQRPDGSGQTVPDDKVVTVCPSRFLEATQDDGQTIFNWIGERMLDEAQPTIVKETPFLRTISDVSQKKDKERKAGRIDWIVVNPASIGSSELEWCAIETQALYFSGGKMRPEFDAYVLDPSKIAYPAGRRRPDYRSSGPKRLSPQLGVKVPVLRTWGKKVVVVVDRYFYNNMNRLADAFPHAQSDQERRDNAEVVWFVVDYNDSLHLVKDVVVYTSLDNSRQALDATAPLSKADFTRGLKEVIADASRSNKVFKA